MKASEQNLTIEDGNKIVLPDGVLSRYRLDEGTPIRMIETKSGILLVPLTDDPMSEALVSELNGWQALGADTLEMFPYDEGKKNE